MVKTVIFDLGGVIVTDNRHQRWEALKKYLSASSEDLEKAYRHAPHQKRFIDWNLGRRKALETWWPFFRSLKPSITKKEAQQLLKLFHGTFVPMPASIRILKNLKGKVKRGLLCDQPREVIHHLAKHDLLSLFDFRIISSYVGMSKRVSGEEIFQFALKKAKCLPHECAFVDDKPHHVATAQSVGMKGIVFVSSVQMHKDLKKIVGGKF